MAWSYLLSVPTGSMRGPKVVMYQNGLQVNEGDLVLPTQLLAGTNTGTPGDGTAISAYHVVGAGILGAEPGSNWPGAAEDAFPTSGTVVFRAKNLYHFDPSASSNGTGSQASPVNVHTSASGTNGRVVVMRQGTTYAGAASFIPSGSPGNKTYGWILSYNKGSDVGNPRVQQLSISNAQWVVVDGYTCFGSGTSNGFSYTQSSGTACANVFFRNCLADGVRNSSDGNNNGFMVTSSASTDLSITSLYFDSCTAIRCGGYGFGLESVNTALDAPETVVHTNCIALNNGLDKAAWGFGGYARFVNASNGWTNTAGNVWQRAETTQTRRVADHGGSNFRHLTENTGTPTAPGANEWGWSANVLYINVGENPNTNHTIWWTPNYCDGVVYRDCLAESTVATGGFDGAGFGADTLTSGWKFQSCLSKNNQGEGFVSNIARTSTFIGCIALNNGATTTQSGIGVNNAVTATIQSCLVSGSNQSGVGCTNPNGTTVVKNSILMNNGTYGINKSGTLTETNNCLYGNTSGTINGASPDGTDVTSNPSLNEQYMPTASGVRTAGASIGGLDYYGNGFAIPGTIGAVQYEAARTLVTRTVVAGTVATRSLAFKRKVTA
jgi:hypothetical protein